MRKVHFHILTYIVILDTFKRRDIEGLCEMLWKYLSKLPNRCVMHSCHIKGCKEGYVTLDGNEMLKTPKCAAPHSRIQIRSDLPIIVQCCTKYPNLGGKPKSSSPYRDEHTVTGKDNSSGIKPRNDVDNDIQLISKFDQYFNGELSKNDDDSVLVGCKKQENRTKY